VNIANLQQTTLNPGVSTAALAAVVHAPIDYHSTTAGMKGTWRPCGCGYDQGGLAISAGYEYCDLDRLNALYPLAASTQPGIPAGAMLDEEHTITNCFQIGPDYRLSPALDTFLRYKFQAAQQPLTGVNASQTAGVDTGIFDTLLPQYDNIVEVGFNWFPSDCFMLNASLGFEYGDYHGDPTVLSRGTVTPIPISFDQENWPITINGWYRVNDRLSLSAGYCVYSNFVGQNITEADQTAFTGTTLPPPNQFNNGSANVPMTQHWNYGGEAHVVTLGAKYALTERICLTGQFEWVHGNDQIYNSLQPTTTGLPTGTPVGPQLGTYSQVANETTRVLLGADWQIRPRMVVYTRYELYNFSDIVDESPSYQTGLSQGILAGFSALF
jgi:hypothetical protein